MNLVAFIVLFSLQIGYISCKVEFIEDDLCDVVREMVVLEVFKDKQTIVTIATPTAGSHLDMKCMSTIPKMHFEDVGNIPLIRGSSKSIMMDFDTTRGIIYHGSAEILLDEIYPKFGLSNPKIRFLLFLTGSPSEELIEKIFMDGWKKYRIFDVFIILDDEFKQFFEAFNIYVYKLFTNEAKRLMKIEFSFAFGDGLDLLENFMLKRFTDLDGYPLRTVLFKFVMFCDGDTDEFGNFIVETLKYQDAEILKILAKYLKFSIKFIKSKDGIQHGYQASNGLFTGSLGMTEYEKVDFAANARLVTEYNTSNTLCLFPTTTTKLKFAVPKKSWNEVNILKSFYDFIDLNLKISFSTVFMLTPLMIYIFEKVQKIDRCRSLVSNYLMYFSILTFVSVKLPKIWTSRWIAGGFILICLIIGNIYSSKMIEFLNTKSGLKQIESIEELIGIDLIVKVPNSMAMLFEGNFENTSKAHQFINKIVKESRNLERDGNKFAFIDTENLSDLVKSKKYALLLLDYLIDRVERIFFDEIGNNILRHIEKTPYEYNYASCVPKTSPFVQSFNEILMKIFEAGISKYQVSMGMIENDLIYIKRIKDGNAPVESVKTISFRNLFSVFYIYLICIGLSAIVFIAEVAVNRMSRKKLGKISKPMKK